MAAGLSDEAIDMMEHSHPEFPGGAPIPTYAPPLPAERGHGAVPNWNCGRAFAAYAVYSWWSAGICLNVCQMRAEPPSGDLAVRPVVVDAQR